MGAGPSGLLRLANDDTVDDGQRTTEVHQFNPHGDTIIQVVYTNEGNIMEMVLDMFEEMLKDEVDKFVGLDLEYNWNHDKIAVVQLAIKEHILVFHIIRYQIER